MVRPARRTRSLRHVIKKTPGSNIRKHYVERRPGRAKCALCKKTLPGMARERPIRMKNLPKSSKSPERPYSGTLCSSCMRREIIARARK